MNMKLVVIIAVVILLIVLASLSSAQELNCVIEEGVDDTLVMTINWPDSTNGQLKDKMVSDFIFDMVASGQATCDASGAPDVLKFYVNSSSADTGELEAMILCLWALQTEELYSQTPLIAEVPGKTEEGFLKKVAISFLNIFGR